MLKDNIATGKLDQQLMEIYGNDNDYINYQRERYVHAIERYKEIFGNEDIEIFSAPGRTEVGGNHTDHQHGMVLAASINLDAIAVVGKSDDFSVSILSEGYKLITIDLKNLEQKPSETGTSTALIKGVLQGMKNHGYHIGPFKAYITSDVFGGSGLSSSAAFETIIGTIISGLYNHMDVSPVDIAIIGQYAENEYFGKPCGLMDQMACSVGGFVHIDFKEPANPIVEKIDFNMKENNYTLCIVDTKGSHANLTDDYASIPAEMKNIAGFFGKDVLRDISKDDFYQQLPVLREKAGDREILRAYHFLNENERVQKEVNALSEGRFSDFLHLIQESGNSSYKYLQNVYSNRYVQNQAVPIALAMSEFILGENGVCRVHGGGFAGTIQVFVKNDFVTRYQTQIEKILGAGTCHILEIRKYGGISVFK